MNNTENPFEIKENSMFHPKILQMEMEANSNRPYSGYMISETLPQPYNERPYQSGGGFFQS